MEKTTINGQSDNEWWRFGENQTICCTFPFQLHFFGSIAHPPCLPAHPTQVQSGTPYNYSYTSTLYDVNWEVLIVIGRTARLARPIRSHVLVEGMHVYVTRNEKLRYFVPTYWLRKLASLQHYRIKRGRNIKDLNHASERALVGSAVSTPGNMFSIDDSLTLRRGSSVRMSSMVKVTEEQEPDSYVEKKRRSKCFCFPKCFMNCEGNIIPSEITGRRSTGDGADSDDGNKTERDHYFGNSKDPRSHVGAAMQQLTGQRVALGVFVVSGCYHCVP